jgi:hypothetical protein
VITGQIPMTLTPSDVWQLLKDRFSVSEVGYMAGVSDEVAAGMVAEAIADAQRGAYGLDQVA